MSWASRTAGILVGLTLSGTALAISSLSGQETARLEDNIAQSLSQFRSPLPGENALPPQDECTPDPTLYNDCVSLFQIARAVVDRQQPTTYDKEILVNKAERTLGVYLNGELLKEYRIGLAQNGGGDSGDKQIRGDLKTPEGVFYSAQVFPGPHSMHSYAFVSYPSVEDAVQGLERGIIDNATYQSILSTQRSCQKPPRNTILGSDILIHGEGNYQQPERGRDWTLGCVAVMDEEMDEIYWFMDEEKQVQDLDQQPANSSLRCATMIYIDSGLQERDNPIEHWRNQAKMQEELLKNL